MLVVAYVHAYIPNHMAGAETTLHDMLAPLAQRGHDVHVVLTNDPGVGEYEIDGVHVHPHVDRRTVLHWLPRADLGITHLTQAAPRAHAICEQWRVPLVNIVHNTHPQTLLQALRADLTVFNTEWIRDKALAEYEVRYQTMVLRPPVRMADYEVEHGDAITLVNLLPNHSTKAKLNGKGAEVFYELARRFPNRRFLGVIGGYGEQVIEDLPNVEIMPHTADAREYLSQTKVVLMPSSYESYGRVATEALASGIPSIVHDTPGLHEALGDAGTYVDYRDVDGYEAALKKLFSPRGYSNAAKRAKERAEFLDERRERELETWVETAERLARRKGLIRR